MDPVSALGVAASAFQFLDIGLEALSLCRQIRDDHSGTTVTNRELETYSQNLKELSKDLEAGSKNSNSAGRRIRKIAKDCSASADDLLELLQKVREAGSARLSSTIKTTFRAMRDRKTIEKLQNILIERRALLDSALVQDIRNRVDLAAIINDKRFNALQEAVKQLARDLETRQKATIKHINNTKQDLSRAISKNETPTQITVSANDTAHNDIAKLDISISDHFANLKLESAKEELLLSLFYPEHASRREMVKPPWNRTFEWIFLSNAHECGYNKNAFKCQQRRKPSMKSPSFREWLERRESVYWICGKAGSGKSTLMAHILDHESTRRSLIKWSGAKKLHIVSFFFWRPGSSPLQRNMQGLLRSLLYQLFDDIPGLAEKVLQAHPLPRGRIAVWTEQNLGNLMQTALKLLEECKICVFIDGLDEFDGDSDELLNIIFALKDLSQVKFCVSSRPEVSFIERFSNIETLKMDQLNRLDIETFVAGKLRDYLDTFSGLYTGVYNEMSNLVQTIARRAEGIFLWAALATQSIIRGIGSGDDEEMLYERLDMLPSGMNAIFKTMLADIDAVHKTPLAFFFRAMDICRIADIDLNIAVVAASLFPGPITCYSKFWTWCAQIEKQIVAQSRGLLQVQQKSARKILDGHDGCKTWAVLQLAINSRSRTLAPASDAECGPTVRSLTNCHNDAESLTAYENKQTEWLHRSVYDFIFADDGLCIRETLVLPSASEVSKALTSGQMKLLIAAPLHKKQDLQCPLQSCHLLSPRERVRRLIQWIWKQSNLLDEVGPILDQLSSTIRCFSNEELQFGLDQSSFEYILTKLYPTKASEVLFWTACVELGPIEYVQRHLASITADPVTKWILPELIQLSFRRMKKSSRSVTALNVMLAEFSMAALSLLPITFVWMSNDIGTRRQFCATFLMDRDLSIDVSWSSLQESNTLIPLELAAVERLCRAFHACSFDTLKCSNDLAQDFKDTKALFVDALDIWEVRTGIPSRTFGCCAKKEFFLQAPAEISLASVPPLTANHLNAGFGQITGTAGSNTSPVFRLICNQEPRTSHVITEHAHGVIVFNLALPIQDSFLEILKVDDVLSNSTCRELLIADVWADSERQLTAWQQLYLLACIRTLHRRQIEKYIRPRIANKKKGGVAAKPKARVFAISHDYDGHAMKL